MGLTRVRAEQISNIDYKQAVRVITLTDITLTAGAPSQVDGVNLNANDRILVTGQTTTSQNGLYDVQVPGSGANGTWVRTSDANATGEINAGMIVMVTEGTTYADTSWKLITNDPIVIGVTGLVFAQNTGASFGVINANGTAVSANGVTSTAVFSPGNNLVLTGNATSDTITFAVSDTPTFTTVSATGNITGSYIIGNGSQLTGLPAGYSNADVATYLASNANVAITTTGNITTTANVSGSYILGNGSQLTGLPAGYANANAVAYGEAGWAGNIIPAANATYSLGNATNQWASVYIGNATLYLGNTAVSANNTSNTLLVNGATVATTTSPGNVETAGNISATGNVTGNYIIGNGSLLTNITASNITGAYGNANVATFLAAFGSNTISTTGAITSGNVTGANIVTGGLLTATGNISTSGIVNTANIYGSAGETISTGGNANINLYPGGTGNIVLPSGNATYINNLASPVSNSDAATKQYVDNLVTTAISYHQGVTAATTANLATTTGGTVTYTQPNGAGNGVGALLTTTGSFNLIDTANVQTVGTRILVKDEGNAVFNGVYTWANATNIVRSTDTNTYAPASPDSLSINDYFFVASGNVNAGSAWIVDAPSGTITFGTSNITFAQFSSSQTYTAGNGISLAGTVINARVDGVTTAFDGGGNISVKTSANLTTPNIGAATGTSVSVTGTVTSASTVGGVITGTSVSATGTITAGNLATSGTASATGNATAGNVLTGGLVSATGNATAGNVLTGGLISATGSIIGAVISIPAGALTLTNQGSVNDIIAGTKNVGQVIIGGATQTGAITVGQSTATQSLLLASGVTSSGNTKTISIGQNGAAASNTNITMGPSAGVGTVNIGSGTTMVVANTSGTALSVAGNTTTGNLLTAGLISATGNVTGNYILGNGVSLTGVITSVANINNGTSNVTVTSSGGNITVGIGGTANVVQWATTGEYVTGVVSATGNVTGGNVTANGTIAVGGIRLSGNLIIGEGPTLTIDPNGSGGTDGNVVITGNLTVQGTTTTINSNTISTNDLTINMANNAANATAANNGGIEVGPVGSAYATLLYNTAANVWVASLGISSVGNITGGNLSGTNITGTLATAAQTNITSVGTLASLNSGTISSSGNVTGANILTGGLISATGNATAGNINTAGLVSVTGNVQAGNVRTVGLISATGNVAGNYFIGNGSALTGITVSGALSWTTQANTAPTGVNPGSFWYDSYSGVKYQYTNDGTGNVWVDQSFPTSFTTLAVTGNATIGGNLGVTGTITYGNIGSPGYVSATGNITGGNILTGGLISATGNATAGNINTAGLVSVTGNVQSGNIRTTGLISATGNITGGNLSGTNITGTLATAAQTNITSVGTLTLLTVTGNLNVDSNTLFVDAANNEVGIGTANPAAQLAIVGAGQNVATMNTSANLGGTIIVSDTGAAAGNGGAVIFSAGTQAWNFAAIKGLVTNGANNSQGDLTFAVRTVVTDATLTEAMRITSAGLVSVVGNVQGGNIRTVGLVSATGNITGGNLSVANGTITVGNITTLGNVSGNIGSSTNYFNTVFAKATSAQYADLAEMYCADEVYEPGTVIEFGGVEEVTITTTSHSPAVAGIVSTNPSYLMNATLDCENAVQVALVGRVPCKIVGKINKGDRLVASDIPGVAQALDMARYTPSCIIGKALENYDSTEPGVIEVAVGRT